MDENKEKIRLMLAGFFEDRKKLSKIDLLKKYWYDGNDTIMLKQRTSCLIAKIDDNDNILSWKFENIVDERNEGISSYEKLMNNLW